MTTRSLAEVYNDLAGRFPYQLRQHAIITIAQQFRYMSEGRQKYGFIIVYSLTWCVDNMHLCALKNSCIADAFSTYVQQQRCQCLTRRHTRL